MNRLTFFSRAKTPFLSLVLAVLWCGSAQAVQIDESFSGSWYNSDQSGHGFLMEVTDSGQLVVYWFVYDQQGNQAWMVGSGNITGEIVVVPVVTTEGMVFGQFNPGTVSNNDFGELRVSFDSCNSGMVSYSVGFGSGEIPIQRLTSLRGLECQVSGDDPPGDDDPVNGQCVNMEGVWTGQEIYTISCSGQGQTQTETLQSPIAFLLEQDGCSLTFEEADELIEGTVSGNQFDVTISITQDSDDLDTLPFSSYTLTRTGTVSGENATYTLTGSVNVSDGTNTVNCSVSGSGDITREQTALPSSSSNDRSFEAVLADMLDGLK